MRPVGKQDRRDRAAPVLQLGEHLQCLRPLVNIDIFVGYPLLPKKLLERFAVGSPVSAVHLQLLIVHGSLLNSDASRISISRARLWFQSKLLILGVPVVTVRRFALGGFRA